MINFKTIDSKQFLNEYWQKKPLVIRDAILNFENPLTPDELAGLAMEEEVESRLVLETPKCAPFWHLERGPFQEKRFTRLPKTHWTLLVQGVDRLIPPVMLLLDHFDFIPAWRIDDVMISYAVKEGSVGPHYDNYDVFLYQAQGRRKWSLTSKHCHPNNYLKEVDLRIMAQFEVEEEFILEPGDMLYLPPHIGHHGVSLSDDCMTYSFGYRSYQAKELWSDFGDYISEQVDTSDLYRDPSWSNIRFPAEISLSACFAAKESMQQMLNDEQQLKRWFGSFVTRVDRFTEQSLPLPLDNDECGDCATFIKMLKNEEGLIRDGTCRMAFMEDGRYLFINGEQWPSLDISHDLIVYVANHRLLLTDKLMPLMRGPADMLFIYELWKLQWLGIV